MTVLSSVVAQVQRIQNYKIRLQSCQLIKWIFSDDIDTILRWIEDGAEKLKESHQ
jgi:hypothetical protein